MKRSAIDATDFPRCPNCGSTTWSPIYRGAVRDGAFGRSTQGTVARCEGCGVDRLAESLCLKPAAYRGNYRHHVGQSHDLNEHYATHDELARFTIDTIWPDSLRGEVVADVGCGGGSLLDHVCGLPAEMIAIDPDEGFAKSLQQRGYRWYADVSAAAADWKSKVDVAFSIQVIEHVDDPHVFLEGMRELLNDEGTLVLSTPNRADILMDLLPQDFQSFFYRTQHRWYYDAVSLSDVATRAGLKVQEVRYVHRYGMANALLWLRDRKPSGRTGIGTIDRFGDAMWRNWLESIGRADNLYVLLKRA